MPSQYNSFLGLGLEGTAGTPVESQYELDMISENIAGTGTPVRRRAINRTRATKGAYMGTYEIGGGFEIEATPDTLPFLMYYAFDKLTSGAGPYSHQYTTGNTLKSFTAQVKRGDTYFVYPGLYIASMEFRIAFGGILEVGVEVGGVSTEILYDAEESGAGIADSTIDPYPFNNMGVSIGPTGDLELLDDTDNWRINVNTGFNRAGGLSTRRHLNRGFPGDQIISGSFDKIFLDEDLHRAWMGENAATYPGEVGGDVQYREINVSIGVGSHNLTITLPEVFFTATTPAITGRDGVVRQTVNFEASWDITTGRDFKAMLTNSLLTSAEIAATGTPIS